MSVRNIASHTEDASQAMKNRPKHPRFIPGDFVKWFLDYNSLSYGIIVSVPDVAGLVGDDTRVVVAWAQSPKHGGVEVLRHLPGNLRKL